ncbi:HNH endonuclease [Reyranella soli]|uniref:HNH endonuclease n=1 Tax=Reyranella soli TaxID=1230389 RepID=UPI0011BF4364|nr:HNH endonuclease signature motif containing protein [Reyranella soli]
MRHIPPIDLAQLPSLTDIRDSLKPDAKAVVKAVGARLSAAYIKFNAQIPNGLHTIRPRMLPSEVRPTLEAIFRRRLGKFRATWEALIEHFDGAGESTCPYCNLGENWEYDHFLPKSIFPEFTLYPPNLIPICKSCNGKKLARYRENGERLFLYVPFELDGASDLLSISVAYVPKLRVSYALTNSGAVSSETFAVLNRHFDALNLERRYARQASSLIARLRRQFRSKNSLALGRRRLRKRLTQMAIDSELRCPPNHWEVVLLSHLAATNDFVDHVYESIA